MFIHLQTFHEHPLQAGPGPLYFLWSCDSDAHGKGHGKGHARMSTVPAELNAPSTAGTSGLILRRHKSMGGFYV